jgi:N-dimethylarginine dimethylaminohydrolase
LIEIFYEDLLSRAPETFMKLFERLEIPFTDDVKRHCNVLSDNLYNAFSPPRLNKWKDENRESIERIIPTIQETMMRMGYRL